MIDLSVNYLGLKLKTPVIAGSCSLTSNLENLKKIESAGAGAVVLKSLFEEQIIEESIKPATNEFYSSFHPEAFEYISQMSMNLGPEKYLKLIKEAKAQLSIPVIASINCITDEYWVDFAQKIEAVNADALEVNISHIAHNSQKTDEEILNTYLATIRAIRAKVQIPIGVKLGSNFTNIARVVALLENLGVQGVVLFNRFYQIDIDINKIELVPAYVHSSKGDIVETLRWISLVSSKSKLSIAGSRGINSADDVIKVLLAGASAAQTVTALYENGIGYISKINEETIKWMAKNNFKSISDFNGLLNHKNVKNPEAWEREQYIKALVGIG